MYFNKISGTIPGNKHKEFEQTFRLVESNMPVGCVKIEFSRAIDNLDQYHVISFWEQLDSMEQFTHSSNNMILLGAFQALGRLNENKCGLMLEINQNRSAQPHR